MALGGKRPGAGRPKGSANKASIERQAEVKASGLTPLDYMLTVLRNDKASVDDRKWAAQNAAPYVHPKLAAVTHSGDPSGSPIQHKVLVEFVKPNASNEDIARVEGVR